MTLVWPGTAYPLGATYDGTGTNFAIFSEVAEKVELCLFGAMTSVGRCTCSMSQAVVADFPVPVAPRSTESFSPEFTRSARAVIAVGWSPEGSKSLTTRKRPWVGRMSVVARTDRRYDRPVTERRV